MFYNVEIQIGKAVHATEGLCGFLEGLYFDDRNWKVRYLVVSLGKRHGKRQVLLSPASIKEIGPVTLSTNLSLEQVTNAPDIDVKQPLSRQKEKELHDYFVWPYYWTAPFNATTPNDSVNPAYGFSPGELIHPAHESESFDDLNNPQEEYHLRDSHEVVGYSIRTGQETLGHVYDFLFDTESWSLRYGIYNLGVLGVGHKIILAMQWATCVAWPSREIVYALAPEVVKDGPRYDPEMVLDRDFESRIFDYYQQPKDWREPALRD